MRSDWLIKHSLLLIMHFVSLKDTLEADCIEFYRNKFPTAFKKAPTDEEEEG